MTESEKAVEWCLLLGPGKGSKMEARASKALLTQRGRKAAIANAVPFLASRVMRCRGVDTIVLKIFSVL